MIIIVVSIIWSRRNWKVKIFRFLNVGQDFFAQKPVQFFFLSSILFLSFYFLAYFVYLLFFCFLSLTILVGPTATSFPRGSVVSSPIRSPIVVSLASIFSPISRSLFFLFIAWFASVAMARSVSAFFVAFSIGGSGPIFSSISIGIPRGNLRIRRLVPVLTRFSTIVRRSVTKIRRFRSSRTTIVFYGKILAFRQEIARGLPSRRTNRWALRKFVLLFRNVFAQHFHLLVYNFPENFNLRLFVRMHASIFGSTSFQISFLSQQLQVRGFVTGIWSFSAN